VVEGSRELNQGGLINQALFLSPKPWNREPIDNKKSPRSVVSAICQRSASQPRGAALDEYLVSSGHDGFWEGSGVR
jgi:hypothetical protein